MQSLILRWVRHTPVVQHPCNGGFAVTLRIQCEYFPHDCRGFLVNDQVSLLRWVFHVAVQCKSADVESVYTPVRQDASDIIRHILKIPFVHKPVDLTGFFVALIGGVRIVHDADKADAPDRKQSVNVLFY